MSKQIQKNEAIYVAPEMLGKYKNDREVVIDERNQSKELNPKDINDKITIYEREVNGWFLDPATALLDNNEKDVDFVILMVCMSYFEGVEQYKTGVESKKRSRDCFVDSVLRIYPELHKEDLAKLYDKARCGLFHSGMVKGGVMYDHSLSTAITFKRDGELFTINPKKMLEDIKADFEKYIRELRSSQDEHKILRENFNRMFSVSLIAVS